VVNKKTIMIIALKNRYNGSGVPLFFECISNFFTYPAESKNIAGFRRKSKIVDIININAVALKGFTNIVYI